MDMFEYFAAIGWGSETQQVCVVDGEGMILGERALARPWAPAPTS